MILNEHTIDEQYDDQAIFKLTDLPRNGQLILNGEILKTNMTFTMGHLRNGEIAYKHTKPSSNKRDVVLSDRFGFVIPLNDRQNLTPTTQRSPCLPDMVSIDSKGKHWFNIIVYMIPYPEGKTIPGEMYETQTLYLGNKYIHYTSDVNRHARLFDSVGERPNIESFKNKRPDGWKRFSNAVTFENDGRNAPASHDVKQWNYSKGYEVIDVIKSGNKNIGLVASNQVQNLTMEATVRSRTDARGFAGITVAYWEDETGMPNTYSFIRSPGGTPQNITWALVHTVGDQVNIITDRSASAPVTRNPNTPLASPTTWMDAGNSKIRIRRNGREIIAVCSQFGGVIDDTANPNGTYVPTDPTPVKSLDPLTMIRFTLPDYVPNPSSYGYLGRNIKGLKFEHLIAKYHEEPVPDIFKDQNDSNEETASFYLDRFPLIYTVTNVSNGHYGIFYNNDVPLQVGDTFTRDVITPVEGVNAPGYSVLKIVGQGRGTGTESFLFNVCVTGSKCVTGRMFVYIYQWPHPVAYRASAWIDECIDERILTTAELDVRVREFSTPSQITITIDQDVPIGSYPPYSQRSRPRTVFRPTTFTMQDVLDGRVRFWHECGPGPIPTVEPIRMTACTQFNRCTSFLFSVYVRPKPVERPVLPPNVYMSPDGCPVKRLFDGTFGPSGLCGAWVEILTRDIPDPAAYPEGQVAHFPHARPPKSLIMQKGPNGEPQWYELPGLMPSPANPNACNANIGPGLVETGTTIIELGLYATMPENALGRPAPVVPKFNLMTTDGRYLASRVSVSDVERLQGHRNLHDLQWFMYRIDDRYLKQQDIIIEYFESHSQGGRSSIDVREVYINGRHFTRSNGLVGVDRYTDRTRMSVNGERVTIRNNMIPPSGYMGPPGRCFTSIDGLKWYNAPAGWSPIRPGGWDGAVNWAPIVGPTGQYVIVVDSLEQVPTGTTQYIYVRSTGALVQMVGEEFIPASDPVVTSFRIDTFSWVGANEFYAKHGQSFDMFFWSNRVFVRTDIMDSPGQSTIVHSYDSEISGIGAPDGKGIFANRRGDKVTSPNNNYTRTVGSAMSSFSGANAMGSQIIYAMDTRMCRSALAYLKPNYPEPFWHPHHFCDYAVRLGPQFGNAFCAFVTPIRPRLLPERWYGSIGRYRNSNGSLPVTWQRLWGPGSAENKFVNEHLVENVNTIWSYSGFNDGFKQNNPNFSASLFPGNKDIYTHTQDPLYGIAKDYAHFDNWKAYSNTNYKPAKQNMGWCNGKLSFADPTLIYGPKARQYGGWVDCIPPKHDITAVFYVRAHDLVTGEDIYRTYKVHWNTSGKSSKNRSKETTDGMGQGGGSKVMEPPKSVLCFFDYLGAIGFCSLK